MNKFLILLSCGMITLSMQAMNHIADNLRRGDLTLHVLSEDAELTAEQTERLTQIARANSDHIRMYISSVRGLREHAAAKRIENAYVAAIVAFRGGLHEYEDGLSFAGIVEELRLLHQ